MLEWLKNNGWEELGAPHSEGQVYRSPKLFVSTYHGDGYWHIYHIAQGATYAPETAAATGNGLAALQKALHLNGWTPKLESPERARSARA